MAPTKKIKYKISTRRLIKFIYYMVLLICMSLITLTSVFLYKNFILVISSSEKIIVLEEKVAAKIIDKNLNSIIKKIKEKISPPENIFLKNPFK